MSKVTEVKFGSPSANLGVLRVEKFNLFEQDQLDDYADLRTRANDSSSGIRIEQIREYTKKIVTREGDGEAAIVTTTEDVYIVVQYWEKETKSEKEETDENVEREKELLKRPA